MSEYMIVPTDSIDATADAIKEKLGSQNDLEWGQDGFASYVEDIPSGGDPNENLLKWGDGTLAVLDLTGITVIEKNRFGYASTGTSFTVNAPDVLTVKDYAFQQSTKLTSVSLPKMTTLGDYVFEKCALTSVHFPKLTTIGAIGNVFLNCTSLTVAVLPAINTILRNSYFQGCSSLNSVDLGVPPDLYGNCFKNCSSLSVIVLRAASVIRLNNINSFDGTPFANGGTGGTIYIPKSLYDHLGDNSSSDYKAATNWSTVDGYGTITWAKIEGSYYETRYADGTLIPTS